MKTKRLSYHWLEHCTTIYFIIMFLFFPLYFRDNYIDMMESKSSFFYIVTISYVILGVIALWIDQIIEAEKNRKMRKKKEAGKRETKETIENGALFLFMFAVVLSTVCAEDFSVTLFNGEGKHFGALAILLCCGVYLLVSKGFYLGSAIQGSLVAGTGIVSILGVLNRFGIDVLHMYDNLVKFQWESFLSTIGNINIFSSYMCIVVPLLMGFFLFTKHMVWKILYGIAVFLGIMAGICSNSDSFFLGMGAALLFYLWFFMESKERLGRYLVLCMIASLGVTAIQVCNKFTTYDCNWSSLHEWMIEDVPWLLVTIVFGVGYYILHKMEKELPLSTIRRILFSGIAVASVCFLVYVVFLNIDGGSEKKSILIFNDSWGTNRGYVWKRTVDLYAKLPIHQKIIGIGPGGFPQFFEMYYEETISRFKQYFVDAHNEFLQFLVTTGILGVTGYFGILISAIVRCIKSKKSLNIIFSAVLVTWIAQGFVNNPLVLTTPYIFMFLGASMAVSQNNMRIDERVL